MCDPDLCMDFFETHLRANTKAEVVDSPGQEPFKQRLLHHLHPFCFYGKLSFDTANNTAIDSLCPSHGKVTQPGLPRQIVPVKELQIHHSS